MKCVYNDKLMWSKGISIETQYREVFLYKTGINPDAVLSAVESMIKVFKGVAESVWEIISNLFKEYKIERLKHRWRIKRKIPLRDQVMDRKPMMARARNNL
ncbi:hypothetical protein ACM26V_00325 [Salipaludibacillus sp. HK11]|uniref:hypothetical protein n=1 Tax=Salipaludibacillus sp. HK11 TaxID=3394320 RepID=UPI0039FD811E